MSDKERYKSDLTEENNDSSSTTTTTVYSNRAISSILNNNSDLNQQLNFQQQQLPKSPNTPPNNLMETNITRYEIKHLSGDPDYDDEFNDDYDSGGIGRRSILIDDLDVRGIVEYFDDTELQPTTANMILDFDPQKVLELPESNIKKSILKMDTPRDIRGDSSDENKDFLKSQIEDEKSIFKRKRVSNTSNLSSVQSNSSKIAKKTSFVNPLSSIRRESMKRPSLRSNSKSNITSGGSFNEIKRLQRINSFKNQNFYGEKSDEDGSFQEDDENESDTYIPYKKEFEAKKQLPVYSDQSTNKRMLKQKQEIENAHQKQIKNLSKQQIQERQHLHQYPHPTQQQRHQQQQQLKQMFTPHNERNSLPSRSMSFSANLQSTSGYIIDPNDKIDLWGRLLIGLSYFFLVFSFPFSLCTCLKVAQEYERAVIFRLGRILKSGEKGPGIFFVLPCIDTYTKVDLRTVTFDVPPQEILTRDSVTVSVDAVVYFRIFNAVISVINVEDAAKSTKLLAASTLRNILGTKSLHEILSDRESVAILIQNSLDEATEPWVKLIENKKEKYLNYAKNFLGSKSRKSGS